MIAMACGGSAPAPQLPAPTEQSTPDDLVDVMTRGAGPKYTLRYTLRTGQVEDVDFDMRMTQVMSFQDAVIGNRDQRTEVPTVRTRIRMTVDGMEPNGDARVSFVYTASAVAPEVQVDQNMRDAVDGVMQQFVGTRGSMVVSARGASKDVEVKLPDAASAQIKELVAQTMESLKRMYIAFPRDPVSIGAQWEIKARLPMMGGSVDTTYRYKLVEATDKWVKLSVEMLQTAGAQPLQQGMLKGKLVQLTSKGQGTASIPLDHLVPESKIDATTEFAFTVGDSDEMKVNATMVIGMAVRPVK